jgi:hypothetical protein
MTTPSPQHNDEETTTLADVQHACPNWRIWRSRRSGLCYAIQAGNPCRDGYQLKATTPAGLLELIQHAGTQDTPPPMTMFGILITDLTPDLKPRRP